jgi:hypothetical protein
MLSMADRLDSATKHDLRNGQLPETDCVRQEHSSGTFTTTGPVLLRM